MCNDSNALAVFIGITIVGLILQLGMVFLFVSSRRWMVVDLAYSLLLRSYVLVAVAVIHVVMLGSRVKGLLFRNAAGWFSIKSK
jgi:hypothetical protein